MKSARKWLDEWIADGMAQVPLPGDIRAIQLDAIKAALEAAAMAAGDARARLDDAMTLTDAMERIRAIDPESLLSKEET